MRRIAKTLPLLALSGCVQYAPPQYVKACLIAPRTLHVTLDHSMFGISDVDVENRSGIWTIELYQGLDSSENARNFTIPNNADSIRVNAVLYKVKTLTPCPPPATEKTS